MFWFSPIQFSITLAMLIWFLLFTPHAQPQTPAPNPAAQLAAAQQETRLAKLEALVLREQIACKPTQDGRCELDVIREAQHALWAETCKASGIEPDAKICQVDLSAKTVTRRAETPAPKTPAKP